jgi:DNA polymerase-4
VARDLLASVTPLVAHQGLTLVGVSIANLDDDGAVQLVLPFERRPRAALDAALDAVRDRYGGSAVTRAVHVGRDGRDGWSHDATSVPLLPD